MFVNPEILAVFPSLKTSLLKRTLSNHCPLLAHTNFKNWGPKPFRFLNCWLTHPECLKLIKESWREASPLPIAEKFKVVKSRLKKWNSDVFGQIDANITSLEEKIQLFDNIANRRMLCQEELDDRRLAQLDLWQWMKRKESYWAQNSRIKWLKEGDKNTKFFHTVATIRQRKKNLEHIKVGEATLENPDDIKKEASKFFKHIFSEEYKTRPQFNGLNFKKLSLDQAAKLTEPFSHEEIDEAVTSCDSSKAPEPDGFNFKFIKSVWEVIKVDIYEIVHEFWASPKLPKGCNNTFIALIPKIENPNEFKDFRPISMVGCIYRIISKLLARRLQRVIHSLISPHQTSFIKGRQILDGALIAGELIDSCKRRKTSAAILKLDFHKAFDNVSWDFLDWALGQMHFPIQWR